MAAQQACLLEQDVLRQQREAAEWLDAARPDVERCLRLAAEQQQPVRLCRLSGGALGVVASSGGLGAPAWPVLHKVPAALPPVAVPVPRRLPTHAPPTLRSPALRPHTRPSVPLHGMQGAPPPARWMRWAAHPLRPSCGQVCLRARPALLLSPALLRSTCSASPRPASCRACAGSGGARVREGLCGSGEAVSTPGWGSPCIPALPRPPPSPLNNAHKVMAAAPRTSRTPTPLCVCASTPLLRPPRSSPLCPSSPFAALPSAPRAGALEAASLFQGGGLFARDAVPLGAPACAPDVAPGPWPLPAGDGHVHAWPWASPSFACTAFMPRRQASLPSLPAPSCSRLCSGANRHQVPGLRQDAQGCAGRVARAGRVKWP